MDTSSIQGLGNIKTIIDQQWNAVGMKHLLETHSQAIQVARREVFLAQLDHPCTASGGCSDHFGKRACSRLVTVGHHIQTGNPQSGIRCQ
jgi:hypothetical protein